MFNFMLLGMSFSTVVANMIDQEKLDGIMHVMNPVISFAMIVAILNLAAPLDYHLIFGAGIYTAVYIAARAAGKYLGAWSGARATHAPKTVQQYLGFTLLPHSGVSWSLLGIAVSVLAENAPDCAAPYSGTIAARRSSTRSLPYLWPRRALNGQASWGKPTTALPRRKGRSVYDSEGAPGTQPR